jgi:hypothetical protein
MHAGFPTLNGQELRQCLGLIWGNLYQAIEETVVLCIAIRLPDHIAPCRIPDDSVDPKLPFRWCFSFLPNHVDFR